MNKRESDGIVSISDNKLNKQSNNDNITIYTINDKMDKSDEFGNPILVGENAKDRSEACAMRVRYSNGEKLYIKRGGTGNKLLNLNDPFDYPDPKKLRNGIEMWQYREVNSTAFSLYLRFLKTKNPLYLTQAERETI